MIAAEQRAAGDVRRRTRLSADVGRHEAARTVQPKRGRCVHDCVACTRSLVRRYCGGGVSVGSVFATMASLVLSHCGSHQRSHRHNRFVRHTLQTDGMVSAVLVTAVCILVQQVVRASSCSPNKPLVPTAQTLARLGPRSVHAAAAAQRQRYAERPEADRDCDLVV
jgi:hypothetical protein